MPLNVGNLVPASLKSKQVATEEYVDNGISNSGYVTSEAVQEAIANDTTTIDGSRIVTGSLSALSANLGTITAGTININDRFVVLPDGKTTIKSSTTGARMEITEEAIKVFDENGVVRVKLGNLLA